MERTVSFSSLRKSLDSTTTVAVVSSRLGHDPQFHRHVCRFLCRSMLDCRSRKATLIVATRSAIEPWAVRAAELFGVPVVRIAVGKDERSADYFIPADNERSLSRDAIIIDLADRVDAVYVRSEGTIDHQLQQRIENRRDATTRVAITADAKCGGARLIGSGAIGWFHSTFTATTTAAELLTYTQDDDQWTRTDGQWLVHCTRGPTGQWPGETTRQYRDSVLIGDRRSVDRGPIDALIRIVRSGLLVAAATATDRNLPVVCFSEVPLAELLDRRTFRPQLGRWDYEPFGVAIRRSIAGSLGIRPVVYGDREIRSTLSEQDRYRFHPIGKTFDWRTEREWRSDHTVDLDRLDLSDVRVFAGDSQQSREQLADCRWQVSFIAQDSDQRV